MSMNFNNDMITGFWNKDYCEYDEQGRVTKCNPQGQSKTSLELEYDVYHTRVKRYQDEQNKEKPYSILTYEDDIETGSNIPGLISQDMYNNQLENKKEKSYFYCDDENIKGVNYYNNPLYSKISQDINPETNETYNVSYWTKNGREERKDFSVTFDEGIYNIQKYNRFGDVMDEVDLGTLVYNYYNNPKCECCGEPIRIANWKGNVEYKEENIPFEGDCKLDHANYTYELDNLLEKTCKDNDIDYDDLGNFDGEATCKNCGSIIYENGDELFCRVKPLER